MSKRVARLGECRKRAAKKAVDRLKSLPSRALGVGQYPDPVPPVSGAKVGSWNAMPFRVIPERGQGPENVSKSSTKERCHVFQQDAVRSYFANESDHLKEEARPFAGKSSGGCVGDGQILAGKAASDEVWPNAICFKSSKRQGCNVVIAGHPWPVLRQNTLAERIDLAERDGLKPARAFKPEGKAADSRKKIE